MTVHLPLDRRPVIVALAGPNGAGKSTFFEAFLSPAGLRFVNADVISRELDCDAYHAAELAKQIRNALVEARESFVFETVFSDPVHDKLDFLKSAAASGYNVILCFIGLDSADLSGERVQMRVTQGGHDVPTPKIVSRFPRTLRNLKVALTDLPQVRLYDNSDLCTPFRLVAIFENGTAVESHPPVPRWARRISSKLKSG